MIDINELRRLAQAATPGPDGVSLNWLKLLQDFQKEANPAVINELLNRLEASESDCLEQARLNGVGASREAALLAKLEAAEKSDAESIAMYRKARDERDALRARIESTEELVRELQRNLSSGMWRVLREENEALSAKVELMERQEPFDADSDVFRSAFEAALKAGNWPATRQGDGYRSPSTQFAWRVAFSTVNRLTLYLAPGAQPAPSIPEAVMEVIAGLVYEVERNICPHEETHRGGFIWEVCDMCGAKWADDEGGKPEFKWPEVVEKARAMLEASPEAKT